MKTTISLFDNALSPVPRGELKIRDALDQIKNGLWREQIENVQRIRDEQGEDAYREAKKQLPAYTFSGRFDRRKRDDPGFRHSSIMLCDIDKLNGNLPELRKAIEADPHTAFNFVSPSGHGLKPAVWFKGQLKTDEDHKRCFEFIESYFKEKFDVELDPSCKDISRLCFVSYDPDLYLNDSPEPFHVPKKPAKKPVTPQTPTIMTNDEYGKRALETAFTKISMSTKGDMHRTRLAMARLVGGYIAGGMIDETEAFFQLERAVNASGSTDPKGAMKTIRDGIEYGKANPITLDELEQKRKKYIKNCKNENLVTSVTSVTSVTENKPLQLSEEQKEHTLSRIYKRCDFGEMVDYESAILALKRDEISQPLDIVEKTLYLTFLSHLVTSVTSVTSCNLPVTTAVTTAQTINIKENIECYVEDSVGWFQTRDVYEAMGARSATEKTRIRVNLKRLVDAGIVERHKTKNGGYRRIDTEAPRMDFMNCDDEATFDMWLPFGLNQMVEIMPGNIILVAGAPNAGKTALLLNIAKENLERFNVRYLNSEMGVAELRKRMKKFDSPLEWWAENGFDPRDRPQGNFQDALLTGEGNINIIDFLEVHDEFYAVGGMIRAIYEKLDGAIAVIALQKDKNVDLGRGGMFTIEKPRLALSVDYFPLAKYPHCECKIVKAKNFKGEMNPNGKIIEFNIVNGSTLIERSGWRRPK